MRLPLAAALPLVLAALVTTAGGAPPAPGAEPRVDPRWLQRLPAEERASLDALVGYAAPELGGLRWWEREPISLESLRGDVVVIQVFSADGGAAREAPVRAARHVGTLDADDVHVIALHAPAEAETVDRFLARREYDVPVAVDGGGWCEAAGIASAPVNLVVARQGAVRYVGLAFAALPRAIRPLLDEPFDPERRPPARPEAPPAAAFTGFPVFDTPTGGALDLRGARAPEPAIDTWITRAPDVRGKVVVLDLWATWCGPCVAGIPHMNELAAAFPDDVAVIGLSHETPQDFRDGLVKLRRRNVTIESFGYALALDASGTVPAALEHRSIPYVVVVSSDGVVRWQGHPQFLAAETLGRIVAADRAMRAAAR